MGNLFTILAASNCNFSNLFEWNVPQLTHNSTKNRKYNDQAKKGKREYNNLQRHYTEN
jgi:hypothetical protein